MGQKKVRIYKGKTEFWQKCFLPELLISKFVGHKYMVGKTELNSLDEYENWKIDFITKTDDDNK